MNEIFDVEWCVLLGVEWPAEIPSETRLGVSLQILNFVVLDEPFDEEVGVPFASIGFWLTAASDVVEVANERSALVVTFLVQPDGGIVVRNDVQKEQF